MYKYRTRAVDSGACWSQSSPGLIRRTAGGGGQVEKDSPCCFSLFPPPPLSFLLGVQSTTGHCGPSTRGGLCCLGGDGAFGREIKIESFARASRYFPPPLARFLIIGFLLQA